MQDPTPIEVVRTDAPDVDITYTETSVYEFEKPQLLVALLKWGGVMLRFPLVQRVEIERLDGGQIDATFYADRQTVIGEAYDIAFWSVNPDPVLGFMADEEVDPDETVH